MEKEKSVLAVLENRTVDTRPVWLMRQAGRYLPEYQAARKRAGSFWTMCMTPELSVEVTLQPLARFDLDAAILFSDILVIPFALGQDVRFEDGIGPVLGKFPGEAQLVRDPETWRVKLAPVYEALSLTRSRLPQEKTLLGFAGAPWTLAAYMIEGKGSPDQKAAKLFGYREPEKFAVLLDILTDTVAAHLNAQIEAGADAVQLFDSWASGLPYDLFEAYCVKPAKKIVSLVRAKHPNAKIIGFPRATTLKGYETYAGETGINAVSLDTAVPMEWAAKHLGGKIALQGNLDPHALIAGGAVLDSAVDRILDATRKLPFIFNLGHGVLPETPPDNVARMVARVKGSRA